MLTLAERDAREAELTEAGEAAYAAGRVAVLMVAGGEGTRLGSPGPKGCIAIGRMERQVDLRAPGREGAEPLAPRRDRTCRCS